MSVFEGLKVLVLDAPSRQILPILKELKELKCDITTLCRTKLDNGYASKYPMYRLMIDDVGGGDYLKAIMNLVKSDCYDVLLPLSDYSMDLITRNAEILAKHVKLPIPPRNVFLKAYNKQITMEICMDKGIPCPSTMHEGEDINAFVDRIGFPLVAKPRMANGSRGLKIVKSKDRLFELINDGTIVLDQYVIQEFIPQTGKQYNIHLFRDDDGKLKANLVTEKTRWFPIDGGASCLCRTFWDSIIADNCKRLLDAVDWRSYCEIEMIVDPRDNVAKVMEINGRASASIKIMDLTGINVAEQMLQLAMGYDVNSYSKAEDDIRLRCILTDFLWFIKSPDRFRRKPSWFSLIRTHDALFSFADPTPFFAYILKKGPGYRQEMKKRKRN